MASSRLFELLAQAEARPSGAFLGAQAAFRGIGKLGESVGEVRKQIRRRQKLEDVFGPELFKGTALQGGRFRDLEKDSARFKVFQVQKENAPREVFAQKRDKKGNVTIESVGKVPGRAKVLGGPGTTINNFPAEFARKSKQDKINALEAERAVIQRTLNNNNAIFLPEGTLPRLRSRSAEITNQINDLSGLPFQSITPPPIDTAPPPAQTGDTQKKVRVRLPDGKTGKVLESEIDQLPEGSVVIGQ